MGFSCIIILWRFSITQGNSSVHQNSLLIRIRTIASFQRAHFSLDCCGYKSKHCYYEYTHPIKMKYLLVLLPLITVAFAQRPSYAGSRPIGKPELASRFRDPNEDTSVTVANRLGEGSTARIPIDARGDEELVNRLNQWPREHRPFWLINYEQIENARNQQPQANTNVQSRFSGGDSIPVRGELPVPSFLSNRNSNQ